MKKYFILAVILILTVASCGPRSARSKGQKFYPYKDGYGFVLPMSKGQGSKDVLYNIKVTFEDEAVIMRSPVELNNPFISIIYKSPEELGGQYQNSLVTLDFFDFDGSEYIYTISYGWFIGKTLAKNVYTAGVYYAPANVSVPNIEDVDENGDTITYPDFTGYSFSFDKKGFQKYFSVLIDHLK